MAFDHPTFEIDQYPQQNAENPGCESGCSLSPAPHFGCAVYSAIAWRRSQHHKPVPPAPAPVQILCC